MKTIIFILMLLPVIALSQAPNVPLDSITHKITYKSIVSLKDSVSKDILYSIAREWFSKTYKSANDVIQMDDKVSGKIIAKSLFQTYVRIFGADAENGYINYTISIYLKNNKYKYEITNFYHTCGYYQGTKTQSFGPCENMLNAQNESMKFNQKKVYDYFIQQLDSHIKALILDLNSTMTKPITKTDNW